MLNNENRVKAKTQKGFASSVSGTECFRKRGKATNKPVPEGEKEKEKKPHTSHRMPIGSDADGITESDNAVLVAADAGSSRTSVKIFL